MIKIPVIEQCPHTATGIGVMNISHTILATLAGAVYDENEWIALLIGKRSTNGLEIDVDSIHIPLQERGHSTCELARPEPLAPDIVGVVHSHHSMGAFFSQTDNDTLNTRFPSSLVVAQPRAGSSPSETLLGFNYKAEGRASLPCGATGVISFQVLPKPLVKDWPVEIQPGYSSPNIHIGLHECPFTTKVREGLNQHCNTTCGITLTEPAHTIFGRDGKTFLKEVEEKTSRKVYDTWNIQDNRRYFNNIRKSKHDNIWDDNYLRHWGSVEY